MTRRLSGNFSFFGLVFLCAQVSSENTPIQEKTGSCMEARPKGPHTQNGDVTTGFLSQNKTSGAPI